MNLHRIVSGAISTVNPRQIVTLRVSTGSVTNADFTRTPTYASPVQMYGQVQALTTNDLRQLDNLNLTNVSRSVYLSGSVDGVDRKHAKGGDLLTIGGDVWLVVHVLEQWPDWVKVAVAQQLDTP